PPVPPRKYPEPTKTPVRTDSSRKTFIRVSRPEAVTMEKLVVFKLQNYFGRPISVLQNYL
ncbi:MAG: hypothetical protein ABEJ72_07410, partial [Candidatus Aenigmatarchaeota archaeon]